MSISLNNHESRIKALENKTSTSSSWSVTKDINGWMLEKSTGIMIQWMKVSGSGTKRFIKTFSTKALAIFISPNWARVGGGGDNAGCGAEINSTSQFTIYIDGGASTTNYILAIGYLISDRILNYAYACKKLVIYTSEKNWRCKIMSISMNNHESRIKALENKIGAGGGITEAHMANPGYVKFANGLIMNFGIDNSGTSNKTVKFYKSYPNKCFTVVCSPNRHDGYVGGSDCSILNDGERTRVPKITNTGFSILNGWSTGCNYFAIGYLITNRLLTCLREVIL